MNLYEECEDKLIDPRFQINSYEQFLKDHAEKKFTKICMTEVINADMMMSIFGEDRYYKAGSEILLMGNAAYKQMGIDHIVHVYIHSYKFFMAVANDDMSDEDFLGLMKANHEQYELIRSNQTGLAGVSRFVVAFGDELIHQAKSAFYLNKDLQNNFIVAKDEREKLASEQEENHRVFELLTYAIQSDTIVPFYQGIYNNQTGCIDKYEALMRIFDSEGKMCPPSVFLEKSKKLKMYLSLSKIMIDKTLKDFEDKESEVSFNISLLDIQSLEFRAWFVRRLKGHPKIEKVTIEFVETEDYNKNHDLFQFLKELREIGCKIAVDDFGVGFATFSSIISLKPEIIKVDGDIIKDLACNLENRMILESIIYLADLIEADIVAEFVENREIQDLLEEYKVKYSQGYYFAKPQAREELEIP